MKGEINDSFAKWNFCYNDRVKTCSIDFNSTRRIKATQEKSGKAEFGSSDAYWLQAIGSQCPELNLFIKGRKFSGLLDTGADVSLITANQWLSALVSHKVLNKVVMN